MAFSKSSRSSLDFEHFNAMDVTFREISAARALVGVKNPPEPFGDLPFA
jgi:hypothetical protein